MKTQRVHKYANDDPTATKTACGLEIAHYRCDLAPLRSPLMRQVDADARRVTCGNCQRSARQSRPDGRRGPQEPFSGEQAPETRIRVSDPEIDTQNPK